VVGSVDQERDGDDVPGNIGGRLECRSVVTVSTEKVSDRKSRKGVGTKDSRNGIEQLLNSVVGDDEPGFQLSTNARQEKLTACRP
jgi:hypothetical protein